MAKVKYPLLSGDASGKLGAGVVYRKGGIVSRAFTPTNPNSAAQQAQREIFKDKFVGINMNHANQKNLGADDHPQYFDVTRGDARYLRAVPQQDHGGLVGLGDDDHAQYFNLTRGDARYLRTVPQQAHSGLSGLENDDHTQYLTQTRGDARYIQSGVGGFDLPVGMVLPFAGDSAPTGYLMCFGQSVSRATYSGLFGVIGVLHGAGDGVTTFNLPDLRGRVIAGQDDMGGTSANRLTGLTNGVNGNNFGAVGGLETHTLSAFEVAPHQHKDGFYSADTGSGLTANIRGAAAAVSGTNETLTKMSVGGSPHNNIQPTIIMNYLIKI
jgi:microcystin-dependent protein